MLVGALFACLDEMHCGLQTVYILRNIFVVAATIAICISLRIQMIPFNKRVKGMYTCVMSTV